MNKLFKAVSILTLLIFVRTGFALAADQVFFYYTDPAGTPLAMSDASGNVVWRASYMPFGEESVDLSTVQNDKMFVGKEKDSETGLYYFGARYKDPTTGRFIAPDIIGPVDPNTGKVNEKALLNPQRLNRYAYAGNNPYKFIDPDGLDWYYSQFTGRVIHIDNKTGAVADYGIVAYSGKGAGLNNPFMEDKINVGPIVQGTYKIGDMLATYTYTDEEGRTHKLSNVMKLEPDDATAARISKLKRTGGFMWHGGSWITMDDSKGCLAGDLIIRMIVNASDDKTLQVVPSLDQDFFPFAYVGLKSAPTY